MSRLLAIPYGQLGDLNKKAPMTLSVLRLNPTPKSGPAADTVNYSQAKHLVPLKGTTNPRAHDFKRLPSLQDDQGIKQHTVRDVAFAKWESVPFATGTNLDTALAKVLEVNTSSPAHDRKNELLKIKIRFTDASEITFARDSPSRPNTLKFSNFYSPNGVFDAEVVKNGSTLGKNPERFALPTLEKPSGEIQMPDNQSRHQLFKRLDANGNGMLSLAELDRAVVELYPHFNNKQAIMRAYKAADLNSTGFVGRSEFEYFLKYLVNYNKVHAVFRSFDRSQDQRVDMAEFIQSAKALDPRKNEAKLKAEFEKIDRSGGGYILFAEFCDWFARTNTDLQLRPGILEIERAKERTKKAFEERQRQKELQASQPRARKFPNIELPNTAARDKLFNRLDPNGNGLLSLAELDKGVIELWHHFNNKPAILRAYKAADLNGTGFIGKSEFEFFLRYIVHFNNLYNVFAEADISGDRRISESEFVAASQRIGLKTELEARSAFAKMDSNRGGFVLFEEFCNWMAKNKAEYEMPKRAATVSRKKVSKTPTPAATPAQLQRPKSLKPINCPDRATLKKLFSRLDPNGNGMLSLAELDKGIVELWPRFDNKPAVMRAYKAADVNKTGLLGRKEFEYFLRHVVHYNNLWAQFATIDTSDDRRISRKEFLDGAVILDLQIPDSDLLKLFDKIDRNGGGFVLFNEFCSALSGLKAQQEMAS